MQKMGMAENFFPPEDIGIEMGGILWRSEREWGLLPPMSRPIANPYERNIKYSVEKESCKN